MKPKHTLKKNIISERAFWWRFRSKSKSQRFRILDDVLKKDVPLKEEDRSLSDVLTKSIGHNILLFFLIFDIKRFKLDLKLLKKKVPFRYFKRGESDKLGQGLRRYGSYLGVQICTTFQEVEETFELVSEFPQYVELFRIQFGSSKLYSFKEFFEKVEKSLGVKEEWKVVVQKEWKPFLQKKREELLLFFFLTLMFYQSYWSILYLYFRRWLQ